MRLPVQLQPGEEAVLVVHRHWFFLAAPLALAILALVVPTAIILELLRRTDAPRTVDAVLSVGTLVYELAVTVRAYFIWYAWIHDIWVITNQRLVDGQKRHWFHEEVSTADLQHVQDVSLDRHGVLATLLRFGDLRVQTASEIADFMLRRIPNPQEVLAVLDRTRDAARWEPQPR